MTVFTDDPVRAHLLRRRFDERQRLAAFKARLADTDPRRHPRAAEAIEHAIRASVDQLAAIEAEIDGGTITPTVDEDDATAAMRQRLRHIELTLLNVPAPCRSAATTLRRAIRRELNAIERRAGAVRSR